MSKPTKAQMDADIAEFLRTGGRIDPKPGKVKRGKSAPRAGLSSSATELEILSDDVEQAKAGVRSMFRHGNPAAQAEATASLARKRRLLGRAVGNSLGHTVHQQGDSYECSRCGASGYFETEPGGAFFREDCKMPFGARSPT